MNREEAQLATMVSVLRSVSPVVNTKQHILDSLRLVRQLNFDEALTKEPEGGASYDKAVSELNYLTASASYQSVVSWTVTPKKTGILSKVEIACSNYALGIFKLVIGDVIKWEGKTLPASLTQDFLGTTLRGGQKVEVFGKDDGTGITIWADICGKEIS